MSLKSPGSGEGSSLKGGAPIATVQDEGTAVTARPALNFTGYGVAATDSSANGRTDVSIGGAAPRIANSSRHFPIGSGKLANYGTYQRQYSIPFIGSGNGFNNVNVSVETAGTSGVVRLGVYYIDGNGISQLIVDWGTVSAATTGTKSINITTWTPNIGQTYFLAVCIQGNSAVKLAGTNCASAVQCLGLQTTTLWPQYAAFYTDTVTGAFPQEDYGYYNGRTVGDFPIVTLNASVA